MDAWEKVFQKDFDNHETRIKDLENQVFKHKIMNNYGDQLRSQSDLFNKNRKAYPSPSASWRLYNPLKEEGNYSRSP